ncbi:hypothetical protein [Novosphingobium colocasiae]|uniref:hypothetical protein n=1 Tax=Novosphingobium colocasiae TaxID=1256513 RepID=UPI0035AF1CA3
MTRIAALPRSALHLAFLAHNAPPLDHVLYRDARLADAIEAAYPGKGIYLGREGRLPRRPLAAWRQVRANRAYYKAVRRRVEPLALDRLILFLEAEPLELSIQHWFEGELELWEEGLSHYVDLTSPVWYGARGLIQIASGFYPRGAMHRRADRSRFTVRDRYDKGGLTLPLPTRAPPQDAVCFVGSPLVEDGLISRGRLVQGLRAIAEISPYPIRYLPHPREDLAALRTALALCPEASLAAEPFGIGPHAAAHGYRAFVAPVSTALLDLGAYSDSLFVPALFGQARMHRALSGWAHNPVATAGGPDDLKRFFAR